MERFRMVWLAPGVLYLGLAAPQALAQCINSDQLGPASCPVGTDASFTETCVGGVCEATLTCDPISDPCLCGIDTWTAELLDCTTCTTACGNGLCEDGENPFDCEIDCGARCLPGQRRCYGNDVQECNLHGAWGPPWLGAGDSICRETAYGAGCETKSSGSPVFQLPTYTDSDDDGCGAGGGQYASGSSEVYNDYDLDDTDPYSGPDCAALPEYDSADPSEPPTGDILDGAPSAAAPGTCDLSDIATCCYLGTAAQVTDTCEVQCTWESETLSEACLCGVDWSNSAPGDLVCLACTTACGDGVCESPEDADSCDADCGEVCEDGRTVCNGDDRLTCSNGHWLSVSCTSGLQCVEVAGSADCVDCTQEPDTWYLDGDGDGLGNGDVVFLGCQPPPGFVANMEDDDDGDRNLPPIAVATPDGDTYECASPMGTEATLQGAASSDPDGDSLSYAWAPTDALSASDVANPTATVGTGSFAFTLTVSDGNATDQDGASFSVVDTTGPIVACAPGEAECLGASTPVTPTASAADACDGAIVPAPSDAGPFPLGSTSVTFSAVDAAGNSGSCTTTATVVDTLDPVLTCSDASAECSGTATAAATSAEADDQCDGALDPIEDNAGPYPLGSTTVTWSATDESGNPGTCEAIASIIDTMEPLLACFDGEAECAGETTEVETSATAEDTCEGTLTPTADDLGPYSLGSHPVTWSAADSTGNTGTCVATAAVVDTLAPEITLLGEPIVVRSCSLLGFGYSDAGAVAEDVCEGSLPVDAQDDVDIFQVGTYTVEYEAVDSTGNVGSATRDVIQEGYEIAGFDSPLGPLVPASWPLSEVPRPTMRIKAKGNLPLKMTQLCEGEAIDEYDVVAIGLPPVQLVGLGRLFDDGTDLDSVEIDDTGAANADTIDFRGDEDRWVFNLGTKDLPAGLYIATVRTSDGSLWYGALYIN